MTYRDHETAPQSKTRHGHGSRLVLIGAVVVSLAVGYVIGREHVKYELRTALSDAADGLRRTLAGGALPPPPAKPKAASAKTQPIAARLVKKGFQEGEYGRNAITFTVDLANQTGKSVRAFDGILTFTDLLGNEVYGAKLAINDPIAAGATLSWEGKLDYNQFIADHERLRGSPAENLKIVLTVKKVLFDDGEVKEFSQ